MQELTLNTDEGLLKMDKDVSADLQLLLPKSREGIPLESTQWKE
jgi:hypothetical protein